jgi:ribosomal protein S18 acetylase RimI-like enzyme
MKVAISEGHYWVNAKFDGKIIGFIKIGFGKVFVSDYNKILQFPKKVAFLYYVHVAPDFRGKKIAPYLFNKACKFCKEQGYTKALGYVHDWNVASRKSLSNAGLREIKRIYYYKIFGIKLLTARPTDL